jgi:hypothetical protein
MDAVQDVPGTDPDRASWQVAVTTAQNLTAAARDIVGAHDDITGDIGRAVLGQLEPAASAPRLPPAASNPRSAAGTTRGRKHVTATSGP